MPGIDFEQELASFVNGGESSAIRDIYEIIPMLSNRQIQIITSLQFFIEKYEMPDLSAFIVGYLAWMGKNKNLDFISSMNVKNLLKAYTQEELIKGIKVQAISNAPHGQEV